MRNPQKYKQFYKAWNELKDEVIQSIKDLLKDRPADQVGSKTIDLTQAVSQCVITEHGMGHESIARGVALQEDGKLIVYYGEWEIDSDIRIDYLDTHQLLRIYNTIEESVYDREAPSMEV